MTDRTNKAADFLSIFLSFKGRLDRTRYWLALIGTFAVVVGAVAAFAMFNAPEGLVIVVSIVAFYIFLTVWVKRLHDFNFSGFWVLGWIALYLLVSGLLENHMSPSMPGNLSDKNFVPLVFFLGGSVLLGLVPGDKGRNRFDPAD